MSFIYSGMGGLPDENKITELENWILSFPNEADKLLSLDYAQYRNASELDLSSLSDDFKAGFIKQFNSIRTKAVSLYNN